MKKYKLIKDYPGSIELGAIRNDCGNPILQDYFTKYPEFWEEVAEKDYEILEYSTNETLTSKQILTKDMEGWNKIIESTTFKINSIKRLSDGEVFTVGDLVKTPYNNCTRIVGFDTNYSTEFFIEIPTGFTRLLNLEKSKQPIFLTHDGKDIFAGNKVWYVNKENLYYDYAIVISQTSFNSNTHAYFLTREDAEDYIERNKPRLSIEDCFKILQKSFLYGNGFEKEIEKYVRKNNK